MVLEVESYRDTNYRTESGGINLYPQFDYDLDTLLNWLENDDAMWDWAPNGEYIVDCSWRPFDGDD